MTFTSPVPLYQVGEETQGGAKNGFVAAANFDAQTINAPRGEADVFALPSVAAKT